MNLNSLKQKVIRGLRASHVIAIGRTALMIAAMAAFFAASAEASPSIVYNEGAHVIWKIGDTHIWSFPKSSAAFASNISNRFNIMYRQGFVLSEVKVTKIGKDWSLCIGENILGAASQGHCTSEKLAAKKVALSWMSRLYDAIGSLHGHKLTPKLKLKGGYEITSKVSWYGGRFIGKKFANGERFTDGHLTAAAKSLPFGTLVKITTPATGRSVVVRVTDRFKEHKGRALDISQAAAEVLDIKRMGVAGAQIKVIGRVESVGGN